MELKHINGTVLFALESAKTIAELVVAAVSARKSLQSADLLGADLQGADLRGADMRGADLRGAYMRGADMRGAYMQGADLQGAYMQGADLQGAYMQGAYMRGADLLGADLRGAYMRGADLLGAKNVPAYALAQLQFIPTEGAFIGWKKCCNSVIVKLGIAASAKRSHGSERKCRCSKAKVLAIFAPDGRELMEAASLYDNSFIYRVGKVVTPANGFDEDRWNTCGAGIHFYLTREEAEAHQ